jgi:hypothetical protein
MPHIRRQQLGVEKDSDGGDEIVGVVDPTVRSSMPLRQLTGGSGDTLVYRDPRESQKELLERFELVVADTCEKLEADEFAGRNRTLLLDQTGEERDGGLLAAEMIDGDRRIDDLH